MTWFGTVVFCLLSCLQQEPTRTQILRGAYGPHRANNDLLHYHLNIRIDPVDKKVSGQNTIRFKMLEAGSRIQIDLYENLQVDKIIWRDRELLYERELNAVFVDFPEVLAGGQTHEIVFYYSGQPRARGRFGGIAFREDPAGRPWINTACEGEGSSIWWPSKDQWRDEPEGMDISVAVPNELTNVSNGRFLGKTDLGDGYTRWDYRVHYPINSYNVSINVGKYEHFGEKLGELTMDYFVLPEDLEKAKQQFQQVRPMMEAFIHYFGEYPYERDGYKLIQVPYTGMEHQSAVTYGNGFTNGYGNRDWTGVGVSMKFDFIIIHETGHEWFGNAVSAADVADMWIQEGWTTYLEAMYVEQVFGADDALRYINGYKEKVQNRRPILTTRGQHNEPGQDMYFKGALFLHTLRSVMNDDAKWWQVLREVYDKFKHQNVLTESIIETMNGHFGRDMTPIFDQYLKHAKLPVLELETAAGSGQIRYRWQAAVEGFEMPIEVAISGKSQRLNPTNQWQTIACPDGIESCEVTTDRFYIEVEKK